ncbi:MAG: hypothetical protein V4760_13950, partial [Bdellovibrionota bacterium]
MRTEAAMPISYSDFLALATELAPKVNLFADVWSSDPNAEFFGGTSRDYLYWLKGKLRAAAASGSVENGIAHLRAQRVIDVREFILFESDIDVITTKNTNVSADRYGVKKIDSISADRLDPRTAAGQNELHQGFIPAEKIRLGRRGIVVTPAFGDGAREIYDSKPTLHFASKEEFAQTAFAKAKINHPILLALRYIRLLAVDEFQNHGSRYPDAKRMFSNIDPTSERSVREVVKTALTSGELSQFLAQPQFKKWINQAIQKTYRSYTNPTAADLLMKHFGADGLPRRYEGLEPTNQYLFTKHREPLTIESSFGEYGTSPAEVLQPVRRFFPDGKYYHGTRTETAFRSIVFQGTLPSNGGTAGDGLYGVAASNLDFARNWAGDSKRVVALDLDPRSRIIDIVAGPGAALYSEFLRRNPGATHSDFAEKFGLDIIRYPYESEAFVMKNGGVIRGAQGLERKLMKFEDLFKEAKKLSGPESFTKLLYLIHDNGLNKLERDLLLSEPEIAALQRDYRGKTIQEISKTEVFRELKDRGLPFLEFPVIREAFALGLRSATPEQLTTLYTWIPGGAEEETLEELDRSILERVLELNSKLDDAALLKKIVALATEQRGGELLQAITAYEARKLGPDRVLQETFL